MLWCALTTPFHPYFLRKRYLSVALALGSPPVVVNNYPALRCSDFPHGRNQSSTLPYSSLTLLFYKKTSHISSTIFRESENFLCWKKESTSIFPPYVLNIRNTYQQFQASSVFKISSQTICLWDSFKISCRICGNSLLQQGTSRTKAVRFVRKTVWMFVHELAA